MLSGARYQVGVTVSDYGDPPRLGGARCAWSSKAPSPSIRRRQAPTRSWLAGLAAAILVAALATGSATAATGATTTTDDAGVITDWNAIAVSTLAGDTTKTPVEAIIYMAFVHAAVYDAVVGVEGRYEPYRFHAHAPHKTSAEAAAVAAAHRVLVTYSPYAQASLNTAYAASLAQIPDGKAKTQGIAFGTRAADNLIALRANDGRNANILFTQPPAPGIWRPTPPAFAPMVAPWMGFVTPLLVRSATQFAPPPRPRSPRPGTRATSTRSRRSARPPPPSAPRPRPTPRCSTPASPTPNSRPCCGTR